MVSDFTIHIITITYLTILNLRSELNKPTNYIISSNELSYLDIVDITDNYESISISNDLALQVSKCRSYLEQKLSSADRSFYGINTGFGSLCNVRIPNEELGLLQERLVMSHACGTGEVISSRLSKIIFLLKIINLSHGYSGVRLELLEHMIKIYNLDILPVIYEFGSLGASGDLAPLAHLALLLIGKGECEYHGKRYQTKDLFIDLEVNGIELSAKEGLALLNGTQFSLAFAINACDQGVKLLYTAQRTAALSCMAYQCKTEPFLHHIHRIRNQKAQIYCAQEIRSLLEGYESSLNIVQDPYSFRCVPQVHGATKAALDHAIEIINNEINATTDNPNIFPDEDLILTGGNFHAQPLALILDYMSIALAEIGSISERRIYKLINGDRGLPDFLAHDPGLHSGFMIAQYTAASIVSKNKELCHPSSVDSIPSSKGQEDHVSMAANAGTKSYKLVENLWSILGIEILVSAQAVDFREIDNEIPIMDLHRNFRQYISHMLEDRILHQDIRDSIAFLRRP